MDDLLTLKDLAIKLNITPKTLRLWVKAKNIPHIKINTIYRFDLSEVLEHLKKETRK
jgi:excisionase family DNA binding protein